MAFIDWSPQLSVKVDKMDKQHQKLVGFINQLHQAMSEGKGREQLLPILERVVDYTVEHFSDEEQFMKSIDFSGYDEHCAEHAELVKQVSAYLEKIRAGETISTVELLSFLRNWLVDHIQKTDIIYGTFACENVTANATN